jgi:hypothetical protein
VWVHHTQDGDLKSGRGAFLAVAMGGGDLADPMDRLTAWGSRRGFLCAAEILARQFLRRPELLKHMNSRGEA